jgi:nucleoside-diphosphate-sugar epimerase
MKIFISGATGFIGRHLAESLIKEGHEIKTIVRKSSDLSLMENLGIEANLGDITDYASLQKSVKGCELIYNTAVAKSGAKRCYQVNIQGTENIMRAALESNVPHVVHCSSTKIYGRQKKQIANDNEPFKPRGDYAITKLESEKIIWKYVEKYQASATIARLTRVMGPRSLSLLNLFRDVVNNNVTVIGSGKVSIQVTYIDDIIDGLKLCGGKQASGEGYIIGTDEYFTLEQLIATIARHAGVKCTPINIPAAPFVLAASVGHFICDFFGKEPQILHKIDFFTKHLAHDISKTKHQLGYSTKVSLGEGVQRTLNWYQQNNYI